MPRRRQRGAGKRRARQRGRPHKTSARAQHSREPATNAAILWQVYACAALCSAGFIVGTLRLLGETGLHLPTSARTVASAAIAVCIGVVLGLWVPRLLIRRRLAGHSPGPLSSVPPAPEPLPAQASPQPVGFEFAASFTGALILTLGLLLALSGALATTLETYRALLTQRFLHPAWLTRLLLMPPAWISLLLLSTVTTTVVVAMHGWHDLVGPPRASAARLWIVILAATAAACGAAIAIPNETAWTLSAPLAAFAAGVVAVLRKPFGHASPQAQTTHIENTGHFATPLLTSAATACLAALAMITAVPTTPTTANLAIGGTTLCASMLVGALLGQLALRLSSRTQFYGPHVLLAAAICWSSPLQLTVCQQLGPELCRMSAVTVLAAVCAVFAARRVASASGRVQSALASVGGSAAGGATLGLVVGLVGIELHAAGNTTLLAALAATGAAGLILIFDPPPAAVARYVGLAAVGAGLLLLLWRGVAHDSGVVTADDLTDRAAPFNDTRAHRTTCITTHPAAGRRGFDRAWSVDLGGQRWELIVLDSAGTPDAHTLPAALANRLLRRCARALRAGGRLAIELPAGPIADAALRLRPIGGLAPSATCYFARLPTREKHALLILGHETPAWLRQQFPSSPDNLTLHPVNTPAELDRLLNSTTAN